MSPAELDKMVGYVRDGILKLNQDCYGGVGVSYAQADERARNITAAIVGNYVVTPASEGDL